MKWITRDRIRMDRAASAWLIKRFIDPEAQFIFAPREQLEQIAQSEGATPFHVPSGDLAKAGDRTGFDAIAAKYSLDDKAVLRVGDIVRSAEKMGTAPEGPGLYAVVHGFFLLEMSDEQRLAAELPLFDALYRYCQDRVSREGA